MPYHHFTPKEHYVIAHMTIAGFSQRQVGRSQTLVVASTFALSSATHCKATRLSHS